MRFIDKISVVVSETCGSAEKYLKKSTRVTTFYKKQEKTIL